MEQKPDEIKPIPMRFVQVDAAAPEGWGIFAIVAYGKVVGYVAFGPDGPLPDSFPSIDAALREIEKHELKQEDIDGISAPGL